MLSITSSGFNTRVVPSGVGRLTCGATWSATVVGVYICSSGIFQVCPSKFAKQCLENYRTYVCTRDVNGTVLWSAVFLYPVMHH